MKRGQKVVHPRTVRKCNWDDRFCTLLEKLVGQNMKKSKLLKFRYLEQKSSLILSTLFPWTLQSSYVNTSTATTFVCTLQ